MGDAGDLEDAGGFAIDGDTHGVTDSFHDEGIPFTRFQLGREGGAPASHDPSASKSRSL